MTGGTNIHDGGSGRYVGGETPTRDDHLATKKYVDDNAGGLDVTDGTHTVSSATELDFTSGATVTDAGGGVAQVAVSGGGSQAVNSATVTVTAAQMKALFDTYITLVAAPGANKVILPLGFVAHFDYGGTDYANLANAALQIVWDPGSDTAWDFTDITWDETQDFTMYKAGGLFGNAAVPSIFDGSIVDKALLLANFGTQNLTLGNSPVTFQVFYAVADFS